MRNAVLLTIFFCVLALLQASFFVFFPVFWGLIPNWVTIAVILINVFERKEGKLGIFSAVIAGFFLDIFSKWAGIAGFYIVFLLGLSIFIKFFLKRHFQPGIQAAGRFGSREDSTLYE